jgi:hypothetical protein
MNLGIGLLSQAKAPPRTIDLLISMNKIIYLLTTSILGAIGWALGMRIGTGTAWVLSSIGSIAGVFVGWKIIRNYLE